MPLRHSTKEKDFYNIRTDIQGHEAKLGWVIKGLLDKDTAPTTAKGVDAKSILGVFPGSHK